MILFIGITVLSFLERSLTVLLASIGSSIMVLCIRLVHMLEHLPHTCTISCLHSTSFMYTEYVRKNKYGPDIASALIIYQVMLNVHCFTVFSEGRYKIRGMTSTLTCIACVTCRVFLRLTSASSAIVGTITGAIVALSWSWFIRFMRNCSCVEYLEIFTSITESEYEEKMKEAEKEKNWFKKIWLFFKNRVQRRLGFDEDVNFDSNCSKQIVELKTFSYNGVKFII